MLRGGEPDVSDAYASTLWVADYMLRMASAGYAGVNLHGGGDGIYTPIETFEAGVANPRPMYIGMQFADRFTGYHLLSADLETTASVSAYLGQSKDSIQLALINKGSQPVRISIDAGLPRQKPAETWRLSGADLAAKNEISMAKINAGRSTSILITPYAAELRRWDV